MTRQEMIDLVGWHYQTMTVEEQNILSRVEHIVEVAVLRERNACAKVCELMEQQAEGTECCKWPTPIDCAAAIRARSNP